MSCLQPRHEAGLIECTLPVRDKVPEVGLSNVLPGRNDLCRRNTPRDLSLARSLPAMRRLFMDSQALLRRALASNSSIKEVPGGSELPLYRQAVPTARNGECPGVTRGPDAPRCEDFPGTSDRREREARLAAFIDSEWWLRRASGVYPTLPASHRFTTLTWRTQTWT